MSAIINDTGRIVLRELQASDAPFMLELLNSEGWLRYIGDRNVHTTAQAEAYLTNGAMTSYREHGFGLWLVEEKQSGEAVGICGLIRRPGLDDIDLGFALLPGREGKGFAHEAATASITEAVKRNIKRLVAITTPENAASIKLLLKLGFTLQGQIVLPADTQPLNLYQLDLAAWHRPIG